MKTTNNIVENDINALTATEREVAAMVADGLSGKEVAKYLGINERTVENYRTTIRRKLGLQRGQNLVQHLQAIKAEKPDFLGEVIDDDLPLQAKVQRRLVKFLLVGRAAAVAQAGSMPSRKRNYKVAGEVALKELPTFDGASADYNIVLADARDLFFLMKTEEGKATLAALCSRAVLCLFTPPDFDFLGGLTDTRFSGLCSYHDDLTAVAALCLEILNFESGIFTSPMLNLEMLSYCLFAKQYHLTEREKQILDLIVYSNAEIAEMTGREKGTVKNIVSTVFDKTDAPNREELRLKLLRFVRSRAISWNSNTHTQYTEGKKSTKKAPKM